MARPRSRSKSRQGTALAKRYGAKRRKCPKCGRAVTVCIGRACTRVSGGRSTGENALVAGLTTVCIVGGLALIAKALSA